MDQLYIKTSNECSKLITNRYSTSFSMGIRLFNKRFRMPIYGIYGFVRFADEIVDTFHTKDKKYLLQKFRKDTFEAIEQGISLNPVLQSFQEVVNEYDIDHELIDAFMDSMEMDLEKVEYIRSNSFQKINFLRDIKSDYNDRGRVYFPDVDYVNFTEEQKQLIEDDIQKDFDAGLRGIRNLPQGSKFGVYLAYIYYVNLFKKISSVPVEQVKERRIRVRNRKKVYLLAKSAVKLRFNLI